MKTFEEKFKKAMKSCETNQIEIELDFNTLSKIDEFVKKIIQQKILESGHQKDNKNEYKRFFTGFMGECAIEKLFEVDFIDWTIGPSQKYNFADLQKLGINVGVKTVEYGKFPVVHVEPLRPELICIEKNSNTIILCGLASKNVLRACQSREYILSKNLQKKTSKSCFVGFDKLIKITSLEDLKKELEEIY